MFRHIRDTTQDEFVEMQQRMTLQEDELAVFREVIDEVRDAADLSWDVRVADIPLRIRALVARVNAKKTQ